MTNQSNSPKRFDSVISGGNVFDGSGNPPVTTDVGIIADRIVALGDLSQAEAGQRIDAAGLSVAPGFIDIHTHSDISVMFDPGQASVIAQGVTTQVCGNCGLSLGFATDNEVFAFERRWLAPYHARINWSTFAEHLKVMEEVGPATNFIPLAGHGTLRKRIIGMENRPPTKDELTRMRTELDGALSAGVWGLSSGLEYPPSAYADEAELTELCRSVAQFGGIYATHLRNEGDTLLEAVQEAMNVAQGAGVPLQLSHHKAEGQHNWGKTVRSLALIDEARARGLDVQTDQYPYRAFMTSLAVQVLPPAAMSGTNDEVTKRLTDPAQREAIVAAMRLAHPDWEDVTDSSPWRNIQIGTCRSRPEIQGRTILELAREAAQDPVELVLNLILDTGGYLSAVNFAIGEEDIARVMRYAWTTIGSDGVGTHPSGPSAADVIHPRSYGTFPRVLGRYVREMGVLSEAAAIHKMTGLTAARFGITDRGHIQPGQFADITIYDPAEIQDCATFNEPHQFAVGIKWVFVNGAPAFESGAPNGRRAGRVLRKPLK